MQLHARAMISPRRRLSQHFLRNSAIAHRIAQALNAGQQDTVLEIGAGTGALTRHLVTMPARQVIAVEIDHRAVSVLRDELGSVTHLRIVEGDIRSLELDQLDISDGSRLIAVGNIPYHLTGPILFWLYERTDRICRIVLMVQKEVAARIVAQPGSKTYGILSVATALVAQRAQVLFDVSPSAFHPRPEVTSSVVAIDSNGVSLRSDANRRTMQLVKAAFQQRRKKLRNALERYVQSLVGAFPPMLEQLPLMHCRAEQVSPQQFQWLASLLDTLAQRQ
ncbi:MAG: 16S rRNA (adenine(1518)-N(6)/adenine(1519)-N(6))-dimethyltransferase RsmA [Bacteroidota bacterium]|nr:16S rRNA (adenine(1518)-N(6)/adenine(1519)-N(6))-dimethyltransferase RsmA [Bacteroidota bacterium]